MLLCGMQLGSGYAVFQRGRIRFRRPRLESFCQSFLEQGLCRAAPGWQQVRERIFIDAVAAGIEQGLEELCLAWRSFRQRFDVSGAASIGNCSEVHGRVERFALPQCGGQGCRDHLADRVMVVVARKPDEPKVVVGQQRLGVDRFDAAANLVAGQRGLGRAIAYTSDVSNLWGAGNRIRGTAVR